MDIKKSARQYIIDNQLVMERWDFEKNTKLNLNPNEITRGSHTKAYFICPECSNKWYGEVRYVIKYNGGCGECSKRKRAKSFMEYKISQSGTLFETYPELEKEWDYDLNNKIGLNPKKIVPGSGKKAHWICAHGHKYEAIISNRTLKKTGCKFCAGQFAIEGENDLETTRPDVLVEWDYEENNKLGISPKDVMRGSHQRVHWICPAGHKYQKSIKDRCSGQRCSICAKESQTSFPEQVIYYYILKFFPDAQNRYGNPELDIFIPSLNLGIEYDGEYAHRDRMETEKKKDRIIKEKGIRLIRVKETRNKVNDSDNIIYCNPNKEYLKDVIKKIQERINSWYGMTLSFDVDIMRDRIEIEERYICSIKQDSIVSNFPELLKEWDFEKNGRIVPEFVAKGSHRFYFWKCYQGHSFQRSPKQRAEGLACPYCRDYRYIKNHNDFVTRYPQLAKMWDYKKNNIGPDQIKYSAAGLFWWKCSKGHSYQAQMKILIKYGGCLGCKDRLTILVKGVNDLKTSFPEIAKEWNYSKNEKTPENYRGHSNKKVWWKCSEGHEWQAIIANRTKTRNSRCPICRRKNACD